MSLQQKLQQLLCCDLGDQSSPEETAGGRSQLVVQAPGCIFNLSLLTPEPCCRHRNTYHCHSNTLLTLHSCPYT